MSIYGAQYPGIVQYYLLAGDVWNLDRLTVSARAEQLTVRRAARTTASYGVAPACSGHL